MLTTHVDLLRQPALPPPLASCKALFPLEVVAAIAGFCCRNSLDNLMMASRSVRDACRDVSRPWPTREGCSLVDALCPDHDDLPEEPDEEDCGVDWMVDDYRQSKAYLEYLEDVRRTTPPPSQLVMIHDAFGASFLSLRHGGICIDHTRGEYEIPWKMQVWSKEHGLVYEENYPYRGTKPAATPPLRPCGIQFLILPVRRWEAPGVRMVEMVPPSHGTTRTTERISKSFELRCDQHVECFRCIAHDEGPCLVFMDRGESAVKLCKIALEEDASLGDGGAAIPQLLETRILASDPSRTGDMNTRRSRLASYSDAGRCLIAFSYDLEDKHINILDLKRNVCISVPTPDGAGWIRDVEFSPDGKTLVAAHCTFGYDGVNLCARTSTSCAVTVYDCDFENIEGILRHRPKFYPIKGSGYCCDISFSPKGKQVAFQWRPQLKAGGSTAKELFKDERVGIIDLSPENEDKAQLGIDMLNETILWERFVSS